MNENAILVEIIKRTYIEGMGPFNEDTKHKGLPIDYHISCYVYNGWVLRNNFVKILFCRKTLHQKEHCQIVLFKGTLKC
ncbi:hypothetical protein BK702_15310 [Bacillus thuringiensis serovar cameroun]|nr:hypothetical protein BK702_15310 [Bacillus thuringiensis serovar cameroun]